jgi:hypothetical protein
MSNSARSLFVFGIYVAVLGITLLMTSYKRGYVACAVLTSAQSGNILCACDQAGVLLCEMNQGGSDVS